MMDEKNDEVEEINLSATYKVEKINLVVAPKVEEAEKSTVKLKDSICDKNGMPSQEQEEEAIKKKHGGVLPRNPPLISKDNEHAFFDSADWALAEDKGPVEALPHKLEPTRYHQLRSLSVYASEGCDAGDNQKSTLDDDIENKDQSLNSQTNN